MRRAFLHAVARFLNLFYFLYFKTLRLEFVHPELCPVPLAERTNAIYIFWHSRPFVILPAFRGLRIGVLTLLDWKNVVYDKLCLLYGYQTVPVADLQTVGVKLMRLLVKGSHIALALDGPHGPPGVPKPGAIQLSRATGKPVVPVNIRYERGFRLGFRWDRYEIPFPFTTAFISIHEPIYVTDDNIREAERKILEHLHDI